MGDKPNNSQPAISLPKGGGAIKGIGETFQPNLFSGTGNFSVPIFTSPGRAGFGPQLTLQYSTGNGNGPFGLGWQISIPRITRKTEKGLPKYTDEDVFVMSGAEDLVVSAQQPEPESMHGYKITRYRPRTEGLFARIEKWVKTDGAEKGDIHWRVTTKENITSIYGKTEQARISKPRNADPPRPQSANSTYEWLLQETFDAKGNHILYEYIKENPAPDIREIYEQNRSYTQTYLRRILYGNTPDSLNVEKRVGPKREGTDHNSPTKTIQRHYLLEVLFDYGDQLETPFIPYYEDPEPKTVIPKTWPVREDPFSTFRAGFEIRTLRLCRRVLMLHHFKEGELTGAPLVKATDFAYENDPNTLLSLLSSATLQGYRKQHLFNLDQAPYRNDLAVGNLSDRLCREFENQGLPLDTDAQFEKLKGNNGWAVIIDNKPYSIIEEADKLAVYHYLSAAMPSVSFCYSQFQPQKQHYQSLSARNDDLPPFSLKNPETTLVDLFGDGLPDILNTTPTGYYYWKNLGNGRLDMRHPQHTVPAGLTLSQPGVAFADLGGDGLSDLMVVDESISGFFEATPDGGWKRFKKIDYPSFGLNDPNVRLVDLTGDGRSDALMTLDHHFLWFECLGEDGYGEPRAVERIRDLDDFPDIYFNDPSGRVRLADMTGDGLNDIVLVHNGRIDYWPNLGYGHFGRRIVMKNAPRLAYGFDPSRLFLADLDGSGCADLVYVDFGKVHFWLNQSGNGWSQEQVIHGTPYVTDLSSVQFADVFGTGTATLVWSYDFDFQPGGNYKALDFCGGIKPHLLTEMDNNMGATTRVQYAPSTKFYLEDKQNGLDWATNLPFPVQVVEKVEVIDHIGKTKLVTTYKYHHGYFDGREREFRGFGRVDQFDTETFDDFTGSGLHGADQEFTNNDRAFHDPPVETRNWFHTGIYYDEDRPVAEGRFFDHHELMDRYRLEYSDKDPEAFQLPSHEFDGSEPEAPHEAFRALRGALLRSEIYARDDTDKHDLPYVVTENRYLVKQLQSKNGDHHGVYFTTIRESLTHHYERNPTDPRVAHTLTLEVDDYGNVLKSAAIGYGRRENIIVLDENDEPKFISNPGLSELAPEDQEKQKLIHITCTENRFTRPYTENPDPGGLTASMAIDEPDAYRTPLPAESITYEIRRADQDNSGQRGTILFGFEDILAVFEQAADGSHEIAYEDLEFKAAKDAVQDNPARKEEYFRRVIEHVRTLYHRDNLEGLLPLGALEPLALPGESYKLAFTPGLLDTVYKRKGPDGDMLDLLPPGNRQEVLGDAGGYVHSDADDTWWIPSGQVFYHKDVDVANPVNTAADELIEARNHFYLPRKYTDPFKQSSMVDYVYDLLINRTEDALENMVQAEYDYRVLQPNRVIDPNNNHTIVTFDVLGLLVGTAIQGKVTDAKSESGDNLEDFRADLTQAERNAFFVYADPHIPAIDLLDQATTRIIYDLDCFHRSQVANPDEPDKWLPVYATTLARETHVNFPPVEGDEKIQISFSFSDGFGREIQKKIQAEPGPLDVNDPQAPIGNPRWVGSGWTIFNNKGKPVRQYEPFFDDSHAFRFSHIEGVSPILFYDPLERVVCTLHPNRTYEKVVFDAWKQETWDVNDTLHPEFGATVQEFTEGERQWFDPSEDNDVGRFFRRLSKNEYLPTWFRQRMDPELALARWPDDTGDPEGRERNRRTRKAERIAARNALAHAATPATAHLDVLGRPFLTAADNGLGNDGQREYIETRVQLDIQGNDRIITDPMGIQAFRHDVDMLKRKIVIHSADAGRKAVLLSVDEKPLCSLDANGNRVSMEYDAMRRPKQTWVEPSGVNRILSEVVIYGEEMDVLFGEEAISRLGNHRGQAFATLDGAGLVLNLAYDFKSNLLAASRRLARDYGQNAEGAMPADRKALAPDWQSVDFDQSLSKIQEALQDQLESETSISISRFDALNRAYQTLAPDHDQPVDMLPILDRIWLDQVFAWLKDKSGTLSPPFSADGSEYNYAFNDAGLLETVKLDLRSERETNPSGQTVRCFVENIDYNAKGQRQRIEYGNGVFTEYAYCPETFRLSRLFSYKSVLSHPVQDLIYTYDPVGNISQIEDGVFPIVFHSNEKVCPTSLYQYDPTYRLVRASGREHRAMTQAILTSNGKSKDIFINTETQSINNGQALRSYIEKYRYDRSGNIKEIRHVAKNGSWTRTQSYATSPTAKHPGVPRSNRLLNSGTNGQNGNEIKHSHDPNGNIIHMPNLPELTWDQADRLKQVKLDKSGDNWAWYTYDSTSMRVRKVVRKSGTSDVERIYVGGFERWRDMANLSKNRITLHVMDGQKRIALVETEDPTGTNSTRIRYQLPNHLGSSVMQLDEYAKKISYEEYFPYGGTAYLAGENWSEVENKRYRYSGKEWDEETGLYYYGARYFSPWTGRWLSCDPLLFNAPFVSAYLFLFNSPIIFVDIEGRKPINHKYGTLEEQIIESKFWMYYGDSYVKVTQIEGETKRINVLRINTPSEEELRSPLKNAFGLVQRWDLRAVLYMGELAKCRVFDNNNFNLFDLSRDITDRLKVQPSAQNKESVTNMFRHIIWLSIMTSIYGKEMADTAGDIHERKETEAVITGEWNSQNKNEIIDTYVDLINNVYGQELGEELKKRFNINRKTIWTDQLTTDYLNSVLDYFNAQFGYEFTKYNRTNKTVIQLTELLNEFRDNTRDKPLILPGHAK